MLPAPTPIRFTDLVHLRMVKSLDAEADSEDKRKMTAAFVAAGVRVPRTLATFEKPADLRLENLPPDVVIKPAVGHSSRGVLVLARVPEFPSAYRELLKGWVLSAAQIRARLDPRDAPFLVEERLTGENGPGQTPYDYKCYVFGDEIALIIQVNTNVRPTGLAFFDGSFEPLPVEGRVVSTWKHVRLEPHRRPQCAEALQREVCTIARSLKTPFVRIDMYATPDRPVAGEMTFTPGSAVNGDRFLFTRDFDEQLGALWMAQARALGVALPEDLPRASPARQKLLAFEAKAGGAP